MNPLRPTLLAFVLGLAAIPQLGLAQNAGPQGDSAGGGQPGNNPQVAGISLLSISDTDRDEAMASYIARRTDPAAMVTRLDQAVTLTPDQKARATAIFQQEVATVLALPAKDRLRRLSDLDWALGDQIRPLLTPAQRSAYDLTPMYEGGGQRLDPASELQQVERVITLTTEQEIKVAQIFQTAAQAMIALPPGDKGVKIRDAATAQVRILLTPDQLKKYDVSRQGLGNREERKFVEDWIRNSPAIAARVGGITLLSHQGLVTRGSWTAQSRDGIFGYKVVGSTGVVTLTIYWTRTPPMSPMKIVKAQASTGENLDL